MEKIENVADKFIKVRLTKIDDVDLNLFAFDFDLTFMVFFLDAGENIYARYGGRCENGPEERMSLVGLRKTMESVLAEHQKQRPRFAPRLDEEPLYIRDVASPRGLGRCIHCHQAKEVLYDQMDRKGKWTNDLAFRFPLPDNLGIQIDREDTNLVVAVEQKSPADHAGIKKGDRIVEVNRVPIHSHGDFQFALDSVPKKGTVGMAWMRDGKSKSGQVKLMPNWRRTDIGWRPSLRKFVAKANVYGKNLTAEEKKELGLDPDQLAFRQNDRLQPAAKKAGVKVGDIIYGVDDKMLKTNAYGFLTYVRGNYLKGESMTLNLFRNGRKKKIKMKLQ